MPLPEPLASNHRVAFKQHRVAAETLPAPNEPLKHSLRVLSDSVRRPPSLIESAGRQAAYSLIHYHAFEENWAQLRAGWYVGALYSLALRRNAADALERWNRHLMKAVFVSGAVDHACNAFVQSAGVTPAGKPRNPPFTLRYLEVKALCSQNSACMKLLSAQTAESCKILRSCADQGLDPESKRVAQSLMQMVALALLHDEKQLLHRFFAQVAPRMTDRGALGIFAKSLDFLEAVLVWLEGTSPPGKDVSISRLMECIVSYYVSDAKTASLFPQLEAWSLPHIWLFAMAMRLDLEGPTPSNREFVRNFKPLPFAFDFLKERREEFDDGSEPDPLPPPEEVLEFLEKEGLIDARWREGW